MKRKIGDSSLIFSLVIFLFIIQGRVFGSDIRVKLRPDSPMVGESIFLDFEIPSKGKEEPFISFNPIGIEVVGKESTGVSINTTIINGKFSTRNVYSYTYELSSTKKGTAWIRNINVEVDGKKEKVRDIKLRVLGEREKAKPIFLLAIPSKREVFVGEGFDINYYIYSRVNYYNEMITKFPKLNNFHKRFRIPREQPERVEYAGHIYQRQLKYSARLFAQKPGELAIDPATFRVEVNSNRGNGFGFGFVSRRPKTLRSKKISVNVLPVPSEGVPKDYTGLVGDHDFRVIVPRNRYLVNEAIEVKLEVEGLGDLESYDSPPLYSHASLENFDTKSEIKEIDKIRTKKIFDYTFLPRDNFTIETRSMSFSFFDPDQKQFVRKKVNLPKLVIQGAAGTRRGKTTGASSLTQTAARANIQSKDISIVAPDFSTGAFKKVSWPKYISIALGITILLLWLKIFFPENRRTNHALRSEIKAIKKNGLDYGGLYRALSHLGDGLQEKESLDMVIEQAPLSKRSKKYFIELIRACEANSFSGRRKKEKIKFKGKYFNELITKVESRNG